MTTHDFTFAWEDASGPSGPWSHLEVVRFSGEETLSTLYRYELTLLVRAPAPEVDPEELVGRRATVRIATLADPPCKLVHGLLVEARELHPVPEGMLYRVVLMPPLFRAHLRTRCRIFLEKTLRQIVESVLLGDPRLTRMDGAATTVEMGDLGPFAAADERFTWRIHDPSRIDDIAARPYCVQYNESDLDFIARLLEEEGIAYHFEHTAGTCLLVLSDADEGKARLDPFQPLGPSIPGREVGAVQLGARLRERAVRLRDFDWRRPALDLSAEAKHAGDLFEERWPGRFSDAPSQGTLLATARQDRYAVEARYATGRGACRLLSAGAIFLLDHERGRHDGEYLITRLEVRGEQEGVTTVAAPEGAVPWIARFECARRGHGAEVAASRFRPHAGTPRPRIAGSQTAFVTDEPQARGAEIHVGGPPGGEIGCVRLKFHWDHEVERHAREPTSCWVRVSQASAGAGQGALWHPRVGAEVIVEFLDGDPDRPIVTGRVYNGRNRPPALAEGAATVSTLKSLASPGGGVFNELAFDDAAGSEQVRLHAGRDWNSEVGHDRTERVANHSTSAVGVDRAESTGGDRRTSVTGANDERVEGAESILVQADRSVTVRANQSVSISANRTVAVGGDERVAVAAHQEIAVGGDRTVSVAGSRKEAVSGDASEAVSGTRSVSVSGSSEEIVSGDRSISVAASMAHAISGDVTRSAGGDVTETAGGTLAAVAAANVDVQAGADLSLIAAAMAVLQASSIAVSASGEIVLSAGGSAVRISGAGVEITGGAITVAGSSVDVAGGVVTVN